MKILLSQSKKHFDPNNPSALIRHSVGVMAELIYKAVSSLGEVEYISDNDAVSGKEYDLIFSMPRNFEALTKNNKHKKSVCYFNIAEPSYLKKVLYAEAARLGCRVSDCFCPRGIYNADLNFLIGGKEVKQQYVNAGVDPEKIIELRYPMKSFEHKPRDKNKRPVFLHLATTLGLRKGFWHVVEDFKKANLDAELWCVGRIQKETFWHEFQKQTDPRIKIIGWVESDSQQYKDILHGADFMVFPSFGEGQAGTVIEAMEAGCIPLVSKESGVPYYPLGEYVRGDTEIWKRACEMSNERFQEEQEKVKQFLSENYDDKFLVDVIIEHVKKLFI